MQNQTRDGRMPRIYYLIVVGAIGIAVITAFLTFGGTTMSAYNIFIAFGFFVVFFGLLALLTRIGDYTRRRTHVRRSDGKVETATGPIQPETARTEMLVPILGVTISMMLIAAVFLMI